MLNYMIQMKCEAKIHKEKKIKILNKVRIIYFLLVLVSNMVALVSNMT